jgi:drug/metabolite transporter, DME family
MATGPQSYGTGITYVLIATIGWSLSGVFVRFMPELDGWQINCWRGFWTAVSLFCYLLLIYGQGTIKAFRKVPMIALFASAGFFAFGSTMYVTSLTLLSTATVSVIGATSPLFTGLLSPWVTGEKPSLAAWGAAILALVGMGVIAWDGLEAGNSIGLLVCLMVPLSFAVQTLMLRRYRNVDMVPAICVGGMVSFLGAGGVGFFFHSGGGFDVALENIALLAVMAVVQLATPLVFYVRGAKSVPAITLALLAMFDAVLNPLWPWLIVGEVPEASSLLGGAIIVIAVMVSIFGGGWSKRRQLKTR